MNEPRDTVEPVTLLTPFRPGCRCLVVGSPWERRGLYRTAAEARLVGHRSSNSPPWSG